MKHTIRINGEVKEIDCELGSGLPDKHGREIFEGDIIKIIFDDGDVDAGKVEHHHGQFWALDTQLDDLLYGCEVTIVD